jgi:chloride channel protein, CIC family
MPHARFLDRASRPATIQLGDVAAYGVGGLVGAIVGGAFVVIVTLLLKSMMDFFAGQATWMLIVMPLVGLLLSSVVLQACGRSEGSRPAGPWRTFPPRTVRADITGDIVDTAGREERFPWRLALIRLVAIFATVGSGAAMGTEAPAAYLGVAAGACVGDRGRRWRRLLRPAAVGGGAAGVAALMGIPLVGTAYVLEIGRRNGAPYEASRVVPALIGGFVGWAISATYDLNLIRLVVPKWPPEDLVHALITVTLIGALSGGVTSLAASALYRAKKWKASPVVRFAVGGLFTAAAAIALVIVAEPAAAFGPGGASILWAEAGTHLPMTLLCVALLRAAMTTAAAAAGGCGGIFVPFLAVGDLAGRVFAPALDLGGDIAGAAGAAGGIAGGYRLPLTAIAMVLGVGGPQAATLTCLGVVVIAFLTDKLNPFKR